MAKAAEFELGANFGAVKAQLNQVVAAMGRNIEQMQRFENRVGRTEGKMRRMARAQKSVFGPQALSGIKAWATGLASVHMVVGALTQSWELYQQTVKEAVAATNQHLKGIVSFTALQPEGMAPRRVEEVQAVARRYGQKDTAVVFDTVQAMQSAMAGGTEEDRFRRGLQASETIFAATEVGVPLEVAAEAEKQGMSQGLAPGEMLRNLYVAGQKSRRTPKEMAPAAPALVNFDDKKFGWAVAGAISGTYGNDLRTYLAQVGRALSDTSSAMKYFQKQGLGEASRYERLLRMAEQGLDTPAKLKRATGITEQRQLEGLVAAVLNVGAVNETYDEVVAKARPGLFAGQRREMEAREPGFQYQRQAGFLDTELEQMKVDREALHLNRDQLLTSAALRKIGAEKWGRSISSTKPVCPPSTAT